MTGRIHSNLALRKAVCHALFIFIALLYANAACASKDPYQLNELFWFYGKKYNVDPVVLQSIAEQETNLHPWSFNVHGEAFSANDKAQAINFLKELNKNPWMVKVRYKDQAGKNKSSRWFFPNQQKAVKKLESVETLRLKKRLSPILSHEVRKLKVISTDIGLMQINFLWHHKNFPHVDFLFDPANNIDYAAKHIKDLIDRHGDLFVAIAHYHSNTPKYQEIYIKRWTRIYNKNKANADHSFNLAAR